MRGKRAKRLTATEIDVLRQMPSVGRGRSLPGDGPNSFPARALAERGRAVMETTMLGPSFARTPAGYAEAERLQTGHGGRKPC